MWQRHWRRGWRMFVAVGRVAVRGFQHVGAYNAGVAPERFDPAVDPPGDRPRAPAGGPPSAHPERVRPDIVPTDLERRLWAQVSWQEDG